MRNALIATAFTLFSTSVFAEPPDEESLDKAASEIGAASKETPERKAACDKFRKQLTAVAVADIKQRAKDNYAKMMASDPDAANNPFLRKQLDFSKPALLEGMSFMTALAEWAESKGGSTLVNFKAGSLYCAQKVTAEHVKMKL